MGDGFRRVALAVATLALLVLAVVTPGEAQERPGSWYLMSGVALVYQEGVAGYSHQTYVVAPGGPSFGWCVVGGAFASRRVSVEGEFAGARVMRAREASRYGYTYTVERRDLFLGLNARLHFGPLRGVHLEPVGGVGLAFHQSWNQTDHYADWPTPGQELRHGPKTQYDTLFSMSLSGGLDARLGGRHVALVPSFRVRWYGSSEGLRSRWPGGYPRWTLSGGAALRIDF